MSRLQQSRLQQSSLRRSGERAHPNTGRTLPDRITDQDLTGPPSALELALAALPGADERYTPGEELRLALWHARQQQEGFKLTRARGALRPFSEKSESFFQLSPAYAQRLITAQAGSSELEWAGTRAVAWARRSELTWTHMEQMPIATVHLTVCMVSMLGFFVEIMGNIFTLHLSWGGVTGAGLIAGGLYAAQAGKEGPLGADIEAVMRQYRRVLVGVGLFTLVAWSLQAAQEPGWLICAGLAAFALSLAAVATTRLHIDPELSAKHAFIRAYLQSIPEAHQTRSPHDQIDAPR